MLMSVYVNVKLLTQKHDTIIHALCYILSACVVKQIQLRVVCSFIEDSSQFFDLSGPLLTSSQIH